VVILINFTRDEKYLHQARRDDPPPISPPHVASKLSSHLHSSIFNTLINEIAQRKKTMNEISVKEEEEEEFIVH
jgi:hypothetical protein